MNPAPIEIAKGCPISIQNELSAKRVFVILTFWSEENFKMNISKPING